MAPKEIDLKQYTTDFEKQWEVYALMKNGVSLESALVIAGVKKACFAPGPPGGPSQPLLWEEDPVNFSWE